MISTTMISVVTTTDSATAAVKLRKRRADASSAAVSIATALVRDGSSASSGLTIFCCTNGH